MSGELLFSQSFPPVTYNESGHIQLALFWNSDNFSCWDFQSKTASEISNSLSLMPNYSIAVSSTFLALFVENSDPNNSILTLQSINCKEQRVMTSQWSNVRENHPPIGMFKLESKNYTIVFSKNDNGEIYVLIIKKEKVLEM